MIDPMRDLRGAGHGAQPDKVRRSAAGRLNDALAARPLVRFAVGSSCVAWFVVQVVILLTGHWVVPSSDLILIFDAAGERLRAGEPVYQGAFNGAFFYGPPWAVFYGATSWLPVWVQHGLALAAELAALRYLCGSWYGFACALAIPLMPWELLSGHFNLLIAAGMVAAVQERPGIATATGLAKLSSVLAIDPRDWRRVLIVLVVAVLVTLPWLGLWPAWVHALADAYGKPGIGPQVPVPFLPRFVVAICLIALWRPWSRALAAVVAIPAFYWLSFLMLIAPLAIVVRGLESSRPSPPWAALVDRTLGRRGRNALGSRGRPAS